MNTNADAHQNITPRSDATEIGNEVGVVRVFSTRRIGWKEIVFKGICDPTGNRNLHLRDTKRQQMSEVTEIKGF